MRNHNCIKYDNFRSLANIPRLRQAHIYEYTLCDRIIIQVAKFKLHFQSNYTRRWVLWLFSRCFRTFICIHTAFNSYGLLPRQASWTFWFMIFCSKWTISRNLIIQCAMNTSIDDARVRISSHDMPVVWSNIQRTCNSHRKTARRFFKFHC